MFLLYNFSANNFKIFIDIGCLMTLPASKYIDIEYLDAQFQDFQIYAFTTMLLGYIFMILPDNIYTYFRGYFCPLNSDDNENNSLTRRYRNINNPNY